MMIDIVGAQHDPGELLKKICFFVSDAVRSDHADCGSALAIDDLAKDFSDQFEGFFPGPTYSYGSLAGLTPFYLYIRDTATDLPMARYYYGAPTYGCYSYYGCYGYGWPSFYGGYCGWPTTGVAPSGAYSPGW